MRGGAFLVGLSALAWLSACSPAAPTPDLGLQLPEGYQAERFAAGLQGPTQLIIGPDDRIWLAQLAGLESGGTGQVVALDRDDPQQREVLLDGLFKPTGIAVVDGGLWIASGRDLLRAPLTEDGRLGPPETVLGELPFNGRSNGTLTLSPVGELIYETSGSRRGNQAIEGSASLWALDPADPSEPRLIATGLKGAYAHTFDGHGRLWTTEVADDTVNGAAPPDELNLVIAGADYGWPACFAEQQPAENYGGTAAACAPTQPAAAVFPPRSTPTGVVASPWEADTLLVALWGPTDPSVVGVHIVIDSGQARADDISPFITGLGHPQSLLVMDDGSLLASDFESGELYRITRTNPPP